jgi:hypothetical protein
VIIVIDVADEKASYLFKVSDGVPSGVDGPKARDPFIWLEAIDRNLSILSKENVTLGFLLRGGASQEEVEEVANYLNEHIRSLTIW